MFKLSQITREYNEAAPVCAQINLFGFVDDEVFITKSGDLGVVISLDGVDYECLERNTIENLTRRLSAAFRIFDGKCRVYQYLFKRNRENIPFNTYENSVVNAAIENRIAYLAAKADSLYSLHIYYVVLYEGFRYKTSVLKSLAKLSSEPRGALGELRAFLSTENQVVLIESEIERGCATLRSKVQSFLLQVGDFVEAKILRKEDAFRVLKQILNFSPLKIENARLKHDTFLDYYLSESHIECHRGFLRVDDFYVKVLTLKEPSAQSFPLVFKRLLEVEANYFISTEWKKQDPAKSRRFIHSRRRHFHNTKRSLASYVTASDQPERVDDILVDESKEAQIHDLGEALILNTNYADYSFLFTLDAGHRFNSHLKQEYLAVLETNHRTPYYLNLHCKDTAHTVILGRSGSGKSFLLNFIITNLQKYEPHTFIFDLGGSFESLTRLFGGSYIKVGIEATDFTINPFCLAKTKHNLDFLALFVKVLTDSHASENLSLEEEQELYQQIENLYCVDPALRTLGVLANTLPRSLTRRLQKWTTGGQFGFLFDNVRDTVTFSKFQCFDFQGMEQYPQILEPLLFYILHRANHIITNPTITHIFKAFFVDEAWTFLRNPRIKGYIAQALKTWRKQNAAMILSTQSLDELRKSEIVDVIIETCATKIFLANPDMDRDLYQKQFHLNETEIELLSTLIPKRQFLIKNHEIAKVANLEVDPKSYWIYTNDPFDNRKRAEAFRTHGFEEGLRALVGGRQ